MIINKMLKHSKFDILLVSSFSIISLSIVLVAYLGLDYISLLKEIWAISPMDLPFSDTITITASLDAVRHGHNPIIDTSFDPWHRTFNYPSIWLLLQYTGIGMQQTNIVGIALIVIFIVFIPINFKNNSLRNYFLLLIALISPVVALLLERGNCDIIIYALLSIMLFSLEKLKGIKGFLIASFCWLLAVMLKLYPIFAGVILLIYALNDKKKLAIFLAQMVFLFGYLFLIREEYKLIATNTPNPYGGAYGSKVLINVIHSSILFFIIKLLPFVIIIVASILILLLYFNHKNKLPDNVKPSFIIGASIYCGTFLLGNNFDYRLVFTLFTIPQILYWLNNKEYKTMAIIILLLELIMLWNIKLNQITESIFNFHKFRLIEEIANWCQFTIFVSILICVVYSNLNKIINLYKNKYDKEEYAK